jgi:hypothetical protein
VCIGTNTYYVCRQNYMFWIKVGSEYGCVEHPCPMN